MTGTCRSQPRSASFFTAGRSLNLDIYMSRNRASSTNGAVAAGAGDPTTVARLLDDTEATNWVGGPPAAAIATVDLEGTVQNVKRVNVSAMLNPDSGGRFTALRAFEIWACNSTIPAKANCVSPTSFTKIRTSPGNAFPGFRPRPTAPDLILRSFDVTTRNATHVDDYGSSLGDAVADAFKPLGAVGERLDVPATDATTAQLETILAPIMTTKPSGTIVLAVGGDLALEIIPILRRGGVDNRIIGGDSVGANSVSSALSATTEPGEDADLLTHDVLATAPLFTDAVSGEAVEWLNAFEKRFGYRPTWRAATSYEAAATFAFALESGGLSFKRDDRDEDRDRAREAIDQLDSPKRSIQGLNGPVYFQDSGASGVPVRVGRAEVDRFVSAARQLVPYAEGNPERTQAALAAGRLVQADNRYYERQRVVTIGVNINTVSGLDVQNSTFTADFFLWLRYTGDDDAAEISFPNAVEAGLSLGDPVRMVDTGDTSYQLYRVEAAFTGDFNFRDFPFDAQELRIEVQNATLPSSRIVYAGDIEVLRLTQKERLASGSNSARTINAIDDWEAKSTFYSQKSVGSTAALGDPDLQGGETGLSYAQFVTSTNIERDVSSFLVKNLLPLVLLAAVTYVSLFFSHGGGARVSFGITGILTGAVLLQSVTSSLPNVGYTVALEWGYYGFILLSAGCVLVGMLGDRFHEQRRLAALRRLDLVSRIGYPLVCAAAIGTYVTLYA